MLAKDEIIRRTEENCSRKERICIVPSPKNIDTNSYGNASVDLRLGRWFLTFQQSKTSEIDLTEARTAENFEASEGRMVYVPFGEKFVVHPGRFVLAATLEWIKVPETLGGLITGKSTIGRRGLVIETAAGLHPCFSGCITLELANVGEVPISVSPGMRICQVFFHRLDGECKDAKTGLGGRRKPSFGSYELDVIVKKASQRRGIIGLL